MKKIIACIFVMFCFSVGVANAATYYVDYGATDDSANGTSTDTPWKRCPGMVGFAGSYTHSAGDVFVFKGGVTWPAAALPLTISYSGTAGYTDTYMGGQLLGSPWGTGYPVFDGGCSDTCSTGTVYSIKANNRSYITIKGLKFTKNGFDQRGVSFTGTANSADISYCYFDTYAVNSLEWGPGAANSSKFYVHDNFWSDKNVHTLFIGNGKDGYVYDDIRFYNNITQGLGADVYHGPSHPDGLQIQGPASFVFTNLKIYNNQFRGNSNHMMTALVNLQWVNGCEIYNNLFTFENTTDTETYYLAAAVISLGYVDSQHNDNIKIYNNTISSDANYAANKGWKYGIHIAGNQGTVDIKNNIFSNCEFGIMLVGKTGTTLTTDYNFYQKRSGGHMFQDKVGSTNYDVVGSSAAICTNMGWECYSLSGDPKFVTIPTGTYNSGDFSLQSDSTAINAGSDLSASVTIDLLGNVRPTGANTWDIGAYEYDAEADTTPPTITSATIGTDGDVLTLVFSEPVTVNTSTGFTLGMSGGAAGLTYTSGSGTNTLVYAITGRIIDGTDPDKETGTLDYATVANGIEDAAGNDLASTGETDEAVTNNSTQSPSVDSFTVTIQSSGNCTVSPLSNQIIVSGETASYTCAANGNSGCAAWTGTCGGTGTTSFTSSAVKGNCTVIQGCYKISPDIVIGAGSAVTLGSGAVGTLY